MSGVKILHFLKDWWKSIPIHQNYTMALTVTSCSFCAIKECQKSELDPRNYSALSAYLLVIIVIVLTLEQISNLGRKKLMKGYFLPKK